jgi:hypothetical protein
MRVSHVHQVFQLWVNLAALYVFHVLLELTIRIRPRKETKNAFVALLANLHNFKKWLNAKYALLVSSPLPKVQIIVSLVKLVATMAKPATQSVLFVPRVHSLLRSDKVNVLRVQLVNFRVWKELMDVPFVQWASMHLMKVLSTVQTAQSDSIKTVRDSLLVLHAPTAPTLSLKGRQPVCPVLKASMRLLVKLVLLLVPLVPMERFKINKGKPHALPVQLASFHMKMLTILAW